MDVRTERNWKDIYEGGDVWLGLGGGDIEIITRQTQNSCTLLKCPELNWKLQKIDELLKTPLFNLGGKHQLARMVQPGAGGYSIFDAEHNEWITSQLEASTTRDQHSQLVVCLALELALQSPGLSSSQIEALGIAAALHDAKHPAYSHAGERGQADLARMADEREYSASWFGDQFPELKFGQDIPPEKLIALGKTKEQRGALSSHEKSLVVDLRDPSSTLRRDLGEIVNEQNLPLIMEVLSEQRLGSILAIADTLAYLLHDPIDLTGSALHFSNGASLIKGLFEVIFYDVTDQCLQVRAEQSFPIGKKRVEDWLSIRAEMYRAFYRHPISATGEAMRQRAITLAYFVTDLDLDKIQRYGDEAFRSLMRREIQGLTLKARTAKNFQRISRALESLVAAFYGYVESRPIALSGRVLSTNYVEHIFPCARDQKTRRLTHVFAGGRWAPVSDRLIDRAVAAARRISPRSPVADGAVAVVSPIEYGVKKLSLGNRVVVTPSVQNSVTSMGDVLVGKYVLVCPGSSDRLTSAVVRSCIGGLFSVGPKLAGVGTREITHLDLPLPEETTLE